MSVLDLYGLSRPYQMSRVLPLLTALAFLAGLLMLGALGWSVDVVRYASYRWYFLVYVIVASAAAAVLSFRPAVAWLLITVIFLDCSLAIGTLALKKLGLARVALAPSNDTVAKSEPAFQYHPLLQARPIPGYRGVTHDDQPVQHDRFGLRGRDLDESAVSKKKLIAVFGGSTTYDIGVGTGHTWPEVLNDALGADYVVLNYGVLGYSSAEHVVQTAFYAKAYNRYPECSIYYLGWNDIRNSQLPNLDPGYANFHLLSQIDNLQVRKTPLAVHVSPIARIGFRQTQGFFDTVPRSPEFRDLKPSAAVDARLEEIFRRNVRSIAAINQANGIRTVFVGQILNRAQLKSDRVYGWLPLVRDSDIWPLEEHFNRALRDEARKTGVAGFIEVPIAAFVDGDFLDNGHFSTAGAKKFATLVAPQVPELCRL